MPRSLEDVLPGRVTVRAKPLLGGRVHPDWAYGFITLDLRVGETANLGTMVLPPRRVAPDDIPGELGMRMHALDNWGDWATQSLVVDALAPQGPAANAGLIAGDVLVEVDGIACGGTAAFVCRNALRVPVGRKLNLATARGHVARVQAR